LIQNLYLKLMPKTNTYEHHLDNNEISAGKRNGKRRINDFCESDFSRWRNLLFLAMEQLLVGS